MSTIEVSLPGVSKLLAALRDETGVAPSSVKCDPFLGTVAAYDLKSDSIRIRNAESDLTIDVAFMFAHEWRHIWQAKKAPEIIKGYRDRAQFGDVDEYNCQPAEIDANAFAWHFLADVIGFPGKPTFPGLSRDTVAKVEARKKEMEKQHGQQ
jgi:hypothetical protein